MFIHRDHTIKPILLHGSEVWGYFNPFKKRFQSNDLVFNQIYLNLEIELEAQVSLYRSPDINKSS